MLYIHPCVKQYTDDNIIKVEHPTTNIMHIGQKYIKMPNNLNHSNVDEYLKMLNKCYSLVLTTEYMDESFILLKRMVNLQLFDVIYW